MMRSVDRCLIPVMAGLTLLILTGCQGTQRTIDVSFRIANDMGCEPPSVGVIIVDEHGATVGAEQIKRLGRSDATDSYEAKVHVRDATQYTVNVFNPCTGYSAPSRPYTTEQVDQPNFVVALWDSVEVG